MTEIEAYKFVHNQDEEDLIYENVKESRWQWHYDDRGKKVLSLYIWVEPENLRKFCDLLGGGAFDDNGYCETHLCSDGSTCISNFDEVLDCYGIDPEKIVKKPLDL